MAHDDLGILSKNRNGASKGCTSRYIRVAEAVRRHEGHSPKSFDLDKFSTNNIRRSVRSSLRMRPTMLAEM